MQSHEVEKYKASEQCLHVSSINFPASWQYPLPIIGIVAIAIGRKADRELFRVFHNTLTINTIVKRMVFGTGRLTFIALDYPNPELVQIRVYYERKSDGVWLVQPMPEGIEFYNVYGCPYTNRVISTEKWQ